MCIVSLQKGVAVCSLPKFTENGAPPLLSGSISKALGPEFTSDAIEMNERTHLWLGSSPLSYWRLLSDLRNYSKLRSFVSI